ncbi:clathrin interactor EPSIN 1-like [Salvia miltiorrhiza]|uniref:clathrin interactor EPSIN 1-like n=1 Tax=Salvia miltiorrhiza TaxID=226208 RepID=UPI0025AB5EC0|nr:clathrin interactor EPSIN 1-like [Salvia miltiorrhiza]
MDFMKVFDQTVREIKREVNLKVLKVPEIEQKVLDATDDEPWGPHGTVLSEIAQATKKFTECQMVMNVLWTRLTETGKNWRFVYKSLTVIEYLVGHGSERAVDDIIEHTFKISSLASFEYVEPSGKDVGINVRKKAEAIVALLNNKEKMKEVRNKAAANRDNCSETMKCLVDQGDFMKSVIVSYSPILSSLKPFVLSGRTLSARKWHATFSPEGYLDIGKILNRVQRGITFMRKKDFRKEQLVLEDLVLEYIV